MKILITGNCGFIGQNFVRMFRDEHQFVGVDKMGYASDSRAAKLCPTWKLDLASDDLNPVFRNEKFDGIVNMAAESHVDNSIISPEIFIQSNIVGTARLLEMTRKYNVPRFLQVSTDEVMGDLQINDPPFSNPHLLRPSSPYSSSKASADLITQSYNRTFNLNTVITRSCNNFGPYQYKEKFIPVVIKNALNNSNIPVYGTGQNIREWIYVEDNCHGIMKVFLNGKSGQIYNIGSGMEVQNLKIVKQILSILNKPLSLIKMVEDRLGHDFRYALDYSLIRNELNWDAKIHLDEGLKRTIKWFTENPNYWEINENK